MAPRSNRRRPAQAPRAPLQVSRRLETGPDGFEYEVRAIAAARAVKVYRCPGCDHEIRLGTAHVVVWRPDAADDRRHWHTACWASRGTRGPTRRWS